MNDFTLVIDSLKTLAMKTKKNYLETVHTKREGVLLVPQIQGSLIETYCVGYLAANKRIRAPKFDGYYYNSELQSI
jgi:hypothetical protein